MTLRKPLRVLVTAVALLGAPVSRAGLGDWLAEHWPGGDAGAIPAPPPPAATLAYGDDSHQRLDVWRAEADAPAPLVMFVHGGGWRYGSKNTAASRWLPTHLPQRGYAYATIDYRLVPAATVEQQAEDVAHALRVLLDRATSLGIDRTKVVLMGHSAGAHLVALVGTDERYLRSAGLGFADVAGVVAVDGAAYEVPSQIRDAGKRARRMYTDAFGSNPVRQRALSPTDNAAAPNVRAFLLLHVQRLDGVRQARALGQALQAAGTAVEYGSFPGDGLRGHMRINRELGNPDYAATPVLDTWLQKIFGR
jgi:acetyl esterase/lipase